MPVSSAKAPHKMMHGRPRRSQMTDQRGTIRLEHLARALGGEVVSGQVVCPGPGHSACDRSLAVRPVQDSAFEFLVHSYAGDSWRYCLNYVVKKLGRQACKHDSYGIRRADAWVPTRDSWIRIWREAEPLNRLALDYLGSRGIEQLPMPHIHEVLRFHPRCPFGANAKQPCLLALLRNVSTNKPQAIHRTALTRDGKKIGRKLLGAKRGAVVKLWRDEEISFGLVIGEGLETVLAGATRIQHGGTLLQPAWAVGDAGSLAAFPVLSGIESLTILVDNDATGTGRRAAVECSRRWTAAGREVFRIVPARCGDDMNDLVRRTVT
jgi:hypothetical protein